jgi:hypothetical protein
MTAISIIWQANEVFKAFKPLLFEIFDFFLRKSRKTNFSAVNRFLAIFSKSKHFRLYVAYLVFSLGKTNTDSWNSYKNNILMTPVL